MRSGNVLWEENLPSRWCALAPAEKVAPGVGIEPTRACTLSVFCGTVLPHE